MGIKNDPNASEEEGAQKGPPRKSGASGKLAQALCSQHQGKPPQQSPKRTRQLDMTGSPHSERVQELKDVRINEPAGSGEAVTDLVLAGADAAREKRPKSRVEFLSPGADVEEEVGTAGGEGGPEAQRRA